MKGVKRAGNATSTNAPSKPTSRAGLPQLPSSRLSPMKLSSRNSQPRPRTQSRPAPQAAAEHNADLNGLLGPTMGA